MIYTFDDTSSHLKLWAAVIDRAIADLKVPSKRRAAIRFFKATNKKPSPFEILFKKLGIDSWATGQILKRL